ELAGYIKERQAKRVRSLRQAHGVQPKLAIVVTIDNLVTGVYIRKKKRYGEDILVDVDIYQVKQTEARKLLNKLSKDDSVHGIIVQLPLEDRSETDEIVNLVPAEKDVDGLSDKPIYDPATALAIMWLLSGYNIDLAGKNIVLIGHGKLVGQPLEQMLLASGITPTIIDVNTPNPKEIVLKADVIVTATGHHRVLTSDMIKQGAVVVDAGVASEGNKTVGDVASEVYDDRDDITITPLKGGVGPLTVTALFDNVIRAAERVAAKPKA
ncbi:MAG TPA: bifunctional 5,10-methylenetetrahydrofolate dehydrogenase/5,10-methenyltetrahydrofolate cyclohydrolase, partial [Candidatus Saccharimonadales bacterium]|nr:bifunctional 5,10-methylenetetrahydrofolate dehydrogenase/5,10-methenyltetrahydrofolate cyclohydrolase [Candidatus Saccharimonadales bacterium]